METLHKDLQKIKNVKACRKFQAPFVWRQAAPMAKARLHRPKSWPIPQIKRPDLAALAGCPRFLVGH
jgi:hypothetical protein